MYTARERQYLSRILRDTSISNCEMVSPPGPKQVMESSAKAVSHTLKKCSRDGVITGEIALGTCSHSAASAPALQLHVTCSCMLAPS